MALVPEWRRAWRYWSVRLAAATAMVALAEPLLPQLSALLPPRWYALAALAIGVARIIKQEVVDAADAD
ncbi:hypothetical protein DFO50_10276 [Microvirgula sp. AG722]|uniref:DUF7940 domain-containing protein n=1 Tax=Microvirgula sp. AG722 TaxID=2183901 RepID=UPI000DC4DBFF|nr:hypothetical protein [Microvirgula sp. AG722]RAS18920.1 hypothetical protein DFO50_10276 [Microvirgula sp. AG722]